MAINDELAAMSNINYAQPGGMLDTWMEGVKRCGVKNAMVIALDAATKANAEKFGIPAFEMHVQVHEYPHHVLLSSGLYMLQLKCCICRPWVNSVVVRLNEGWLHISAERLHTRAPAACVAQPCVSSSKQLTRLRSLPCVIRLTAGLSCRPG